MIASVGWRESAVRHVAGDTTPSIATSVFYVASMPRARKPLRRASTASCSAAKIALLLLELLFLDLAARVALPEDVQGGLFRPPLRRAGGSPRALHQRDDGDNQQNPEQRHADHAEPHPAPAR